MNAARELALRIAELEDRTRGRASQLAYSSIEAGVISEFDEMGNLVALYGTQFDGSHMAVAVKGIAPLTPSAPVVTLAGPISASVRWDGLWVSGDGICPTDFSRLEVHASQTTGFSALTADTLFGTIESPRGGELSLTLEPGTWYFRFVARNLAGGKGDASVEVSAVVESVVSQAVIDGINADVAAAQAAADNAQATADALPADIAAAQAAANAAQSDADAAMTAANGKNQIVYSLADASGTAGPTGVAFIEGDLWRKRSGTQIIAEWRWASGAWVSQTISGAQLTNLDAGTITVGQLAAGRLAANSVIAGTIAANAVTASTIAADAVLAINIKAGEVIAGKLAVDSVLAGNIKAGEVVAGKLAANSVIAGNIATDAVTAGTIAAGAVTAGKLDVGAVIAGNIAANAVTATTIAADAINGKTITGATIYSGDVTAQHVSLSPSGIEVWTPIAGAEDTTPQRIASLGVPGPEGDYLSLTDGAGNVVVSLSAAASTLKQLTVSGDDTRDPLDIPYGLSVGGSELADLLWSIPRGVQTKVYQDATATWSGITTEMGIHEVSWMHIPGRAYRVSFYGGRIFNAAYNDNVAQIAIRYTTDGSSPVVTSPSHGYQQFPVTLTNKSFGMPMMTTAGNFIPGATDPQIVRCLLTVAKLQGNGTLNVYDGGPFEALVEDIGPDIPDTWLVNTGGTGSAATPTPKTTYTSSWYATSSDSYRQDGTSRPENYLYQGQSGAGSYNGNQRSMTVFGGTAALGETGKTIAQALSGATVQKVEVRLYAAHWYPSNGGTAIVRAYNSTSLTSAVQTGSSKAVAWSSDSGEKIIDITSIASSAIRGIALGPGPTTSTEYYGYLYDHTASTSYRPWIRITYTR